MGEEVKKLGSTTITALADMMQARSPAIPPAVAVAKAKSAVGWWAGAFVFAAVAAFFCWKLIEAAMKGTAISTVLALIVIGLPALASLFCANRASGEATTAFLALVKDLVTFWRKKDA